MPEQLDLPGTPAAECVDRTIERVPAKDLLNRKRSAEALVRVRGRQAGCWSAWTQGMRLSMREFCQPLTRRVSVRAR